MKILNFLNHEDLAEFMVKIALEDITVCAVVFYEDAIKLLKELAKYDESTIESVELTNPLYKGYDKEYYVFVDTDLSISVDEAWHDTNEYHEAGYLTFGGHNTVTFVHGDADAKVLKAVGESVTFEIEILDEQECENDNDCENEDEAKFEEVKTEQPEVINLLDVATKLFFKMFEE